MHIIAGAFRGKRLWTPHGQVTRPTSAKVKEAIFQILADELIGAQGLDLFAGCGGLGLEALSRGVEEVIFVEHSKMAARVLRKNLTALGCADRGRVVQQHVLKFLRRPALRENSFDLIFADPPYRRHLLKDTLTLIAERNLLSQQGTLIVERWKKDVLPERIGSLHGFLERTYGDTNVTFWRKKEEA
ncbi:MAG: 16S rRNA (guanine(966)-N(2))-methyltransferase RsmD [Candidatus Latescibacterota bacterium]|nr:MAG: 16S rRNA (guanine(966)-N(2))-methyltransferase RsmD [Candidatus Latescibacteria bacterium 4484_107]RKY70650.1 MAG: 16S rRNA (guanine(966)-N(2))-methyltransferase RsmD [Candidatus Latescibacterota bacterium]